MSESRFDTRLFETKVFVVVLVFSSISALGASLINGEFINAQLWTLGLIIWLLVSLTILLYLLSLEVRQFFGFVNPVEQPQDEPTEDKPQ